MSINSCSENNLSLDIKPPWLRIKILTIKKASVVKRVVDDARLNTICEHALCPNLAECYSNGTASFMLLGESCSRNCKFCNLSNSEPKPIDLDEPIRLAKAVAKLNLKHVVITSVTRDDLTDGGAEHFSNTIKHVRSYSPGTSIEILTPDFRYDTDLALKKLSAFPPDIISHNVEIVPSLYGALCPNSCYNSSLYLLSCFKEWFPEIPLKSSIMVGLGEKLEEIIEVMHNLYNIGCRIVNIGQYIAPSRKHAEVVRYVSPQEFERFKTIAIELGFDHVESSPLTRSSYRANKIIEKADVNIC